MLSGQNGILNRAQEAKEKTEKTQKEEQITLNGYEDQISNYAGIDWEIVKANAKAPEEQKEERNNNVIAIWTNGKTVNMDLWEFTYDQKTQGYALNSSDVINNKENGGDNENNIKTAGYKGEISDDGSIIGKIPIYIKNGDAEWTPVTSLYRTFQNIDIIKTPQIPNTVTNINCAFEGCNKLKVISEIPDSVKTMRWAFDDCTGLESI